MIEMKRVFAVGFLFLALVGCDHMDEVKEAEKVTEEQIEVVEDQNVEEALKREHEEYLKFSQEYTNQFHEMSVEVAEHFKKAEEDQMLMFDEVWISELEELESIAFGIFAVTEQRRYNGDVPEEFKEVHDMTESAYKHKHLSLKEYINGLRNKDKESLNKALIYAEASNQKITKATELMNEVAEELKNIY
jgi:hypothetical protein